MGIINYMLEYGVTVYQYLLTYEGEYSLSMVWGLDPTGVCHGDDLIYVWELAYGDIGFYPLSGDDRLVRETMVTTWTNFAKYGDPSPPGSTFSWTPEVSNTIHHYLNISGPMPVMATNQHIQERMALWEQVWG